MSSPTRPRDRNNAPRLSSSEDVNLAASQLREQIAADPGNAHLRLDLGELLLTQRRYNEAMRVLTAARERFPEDPDIAASLGMALLGAGCLGDAEEELRTSLRLDPQFHDIRAQLACLYADQGRLDETAQLLAVYLQERHAEPGVRTPPAGTRLRHAVSRMRPESQAALAAALSAIRHESEAETIVRDLLRKHGVLHDAHGDTRAAVGDAPTEAHTEALTDLTDQLAGELDDAMEPSSFIAAACVTLAQICERTHRITEAAALLGHVPAQALGAEGRLLAARLTARRGDAVAALRQLDEILTDSMQASGAAGGDLYPRIVGQIEFERATLLDRLGRCDEAYAACLHANALIREALRRHAGDAADAPPAESGNINAGRFDLPPLDPLIAQARASAGHANLQTPVFLVGFPRSGATLLDQMLDAHPQLQVLEDRPAADGILDALTAMASDSGKDLATLLLELNDAQLAQLRKAYFDRAKQYLTPRADQLLANQLLISQLLIDKSPINLTRLQLLMRVFPNARWIFAVRHPCDVVLSCFMQNVQFNEPPMGFWTLDQSAQIYAKLMGVWLDQRDRLAPDCFELRYETLINDTEGTLRALCDFLQVRWDPAVLDYRRHALRRTISTPGAFQVVRPPYADAVGRWRRYRRWFESAWPLLAPFVHRLGYDHSVMDALPEQHRPAP